MRPFDALPIALLLVAAAALLAGEAALARSDDLRALYWLALGGFTLRAAVLVGRAGRRAA